MTIFKNKEVLQPSYIPEHVILRETETQRIQHNLSYLIGPAPTAPYNMHISGPKGTGKTVVTKHIFKKLTPQINPETTTILYTPTQQSSFLTMACLSAELHIQFKRSFYEFWETFSKKIEDKFLIVILDDIDNLLVNKTDKLELLYWLSRRHRTTIITISNKPWALDVLSQPQHSSVQSSFRPEKIIFEPYNMSSIYRILQDRAQLAFKENTYSEDILTQCAEVASYDGDARWALDLLFKTGEITDSRGGTVITNDDFKIADSLIEEQQLRDKIHTLTRPEKVYLKAVCLKTSTASNNGATPPLTTDVTNCFKEIAIGHSVKLYSDIRLIQLRKRLIDGGFIQVYQGKGLGRGKGTEWRVTLSSGDKQTLLSIFASEGL